MGKIIVPIGTSNTANLTVNPLSELDWPAPNVESKISFYQQLNETETKFLSSRILPITSFSS